MLSEKIAALVQYGISAGLVPECERIYTTNLLLDLFHEDDYEEPDSIPEEPLEDILKELLDEACRRELIPDSITYRDLFDTRLMNCLLPRPAQVHKEFWERYKKSPEEATIRQGKITGLFRLPLTEAAGDSSILLMYTITSTVLYLTGSIRR